MTFFKAIDIGTFLASDSFKDLVGRVIDELKSSLSLEGSPLNVFLEIGDELVNGSFCLRVASEFHGPNRR